MKKSGDTRPDLAKLLAKWQKILRLEHWDVTAQYVMPHEMADANEANISYFDAKYQAKIKVVEPAAYPVGNFATMDVERAVVHELLHLVVDGWPEAENGRATVREEQAVHVISVALVTLDRKGGK